MQLIEINIFVHVARVLRKLAIGARRLLLKRFHRDGQTAGEAIAGAFFQSEGGTLVGERIGEDVIGTGHGLLRGYGEKVGQAAR